MNNRKIIILYIACFLTYGTASAVDDSDIFSSKQSEILLAQNDEGFEDDDEDFGEDEEFKDEDFADEDFDEDASSSDDEPAEEVTAEEEAPSEAPEESIPEELKEEEFADTGEDDEVLEEPAAPELASPEAPVERKIVPKKPSPEEVAENELKQFISAQENKTFRGSPVTISLRDADIKEVLQMIADASGFNIILTRGVTGNLTLNLVDVPWDQALDEILRVNGLGAERNNNILRIMTLAELQTSKRAEADAKRAVQDVAPRLTRVFRVSYAELGSIATIVTSFITVPQGAQAPIQQDQRTNSLIVRGTADELSRVEKIIRVLDTQTPQVMIEAKIVEGSESFSRAVGGSFGVGNTGETFWGASFRGAKLEDQLVGSDVSSASEGSAGGGAFGFSPGGLSGIERINAFLSLAESEEEAEIIAAPKVVVLDRQAATLTQGNPGVNLVTVVGSGGATTQTPQQVNADLTMNVTPTVTNDESILLRLSLARGIPRQISNNTVVANRNFQTQVIVENGSTLVLGGVFSLDKSVGVNGFPVLKDLPIVGWLFGDRSKSTSKTELFAFVTPTILNTARAGFSSVQ